MTFRWVKSDGARPQAMTGRPALSIATGPAPTRPVASGSSSTSHVVPFQRLTLIATLAAEPFCHSFQTTTIRPCGSTATDGCLTKVIPDSPLPDAEPPRSTQLVPSQARSMICVAAWDEVGLTLQTTTGRPALSTAIETASAITPLDRPAGSVE